MKTIIVFLYSKIVLLSPHIEVFFRKLYWKHVRKLRKYRPATHVTAKAKENKKANFEDVISFLKEKGVKEGMLLVVHSSYEALECTGLTPEEIIDALLKLVGPTGTLAMPAIRRYKGEPSVENILSFNMDDLVCVYNVKKTLITSGLLPYYLLKRSDSEVSRHPLNPMVAVGPLAKEMMKHNLDGETPSPHGQNSSWKFCLDHDAIVVGLGVDLGHYNTMIHVAEEAFGDWRWDDNSWYRLRQFDVVDEDMRRRVVVRERRPEWGMLRIAEKKLARDLLKHGVMEKKMKGGILICFEKSGELISFLRSRNKNGYPYYV